MRPSRATSRAGSYLLVLTALACIASTRFTDAQAVPAQCTGAFTTSWAPAGALGTSSKTLLASIANGPGKELIAATPVPFATLEPFLPLDKYVLETAVTPLQQKIEGFGFLFVVSLRYASWSLNGGDQGGDVRASYIMAQIKAPAGADEQGLNLPGTVHFYVLKAYTASKAFQDVLVEAGFPVELRGDLDFSANAASRDVSVPGVFRSNGTAYLPTELPGVSVVIWSQGSKGTSVLQVLNLPATLGYGAATVFTPPGSCLSSLLKASPLAPDCSAAQPNSDAPGWSCTGPVVGLANEFPGVNRLSVWLLTGN